MAVDRVCHFDTLEIVVAYRGIWIGVGFYICDG